jgi:hypothetical protein
VSAAKDGVARRRHNSTKTQLAVQVDADLYHRARNIAFWLKPKHGTSLTHLVERGLLLACLEQEEQAFDLHDVGGFPVKKPAGQPFPKGSGNLKAGRTPST